MRKLFSRAAVLTVLLLITIISLGPPIPRAAASQIGAEMNDADAELNRVYKRVLDGMPDEASRASLREAQRAWVAFVEAEIALHTRLYTSSKGGIFIRLELTQTRITQLRSIGKRESASGYGSGPAD